MISPARWFSAPRRGRYSTEGSFVLFVEGGRDAGRETVDAPDPGSFTTVLWQQAAAAGDCQEPWAEPGRGVGHLSRARAAGIVWPLAEDIDDARLEALLFPPPSGTPADQRPMPDWGWVHRELRRADVTLALLWEEYRIGAVDGFSYSWFCDLYRAWAGRLKPTMRQIHLAGEKLFVDFAGRTGEVIGR